MSADCSAPHCPQAKRAAYGIIPARYDSSRFPGKALLSLQGKPMFWHVWSRARQCPLLDSVTLATDDVRIVRAAESLHVPVLMTSREHLSGTDRVCEAADKLKLPDEAIIVNIQGDEPALPPNMLHELLHIFADVEVQAATLARPLPDKDLHDPHTVKVVLANNGNALYFSRASIPFYRNPNGPATAYAHIGLYAFTKKMLNHFVMLPPSPLELTEQLEQLRFLENSIPLRVVLSAFVSRGIDSPQDVEPVLALMREQ